MHVDELAVRCAAARRCTLCALRFCLVRMAVSNGRRGPVVRSFLFFSFPTAALPFLSFSFAVTRRSIGKVATQTHIHKSTAEQQEQISGEWGAAGETGRDHGRRTGSSAVPCDGFSLAGWLADWRSIFCASLSTCSSARPDPFPSLPSIPLSPWVQPAARSTCTRRPSETNSEQPLTARLWLTARCSDGGNVTALHLIVTDLSLPLPSH